MRSIVLTAAFLCLQAGQADATIIISDEGTIAPSGALIENAGNTSFTRVSNDGALNRIRGQSFTTTSAIEVDAITLQLRSDNAGNSVPTTGSNPMRLQIWKVGSSVAPSDGTSVLDDSGEFPLTMSGGEFFTLSLDASVLLEASTQYGFSIEWTSGTGNDIFPAQLGGFDGGDLLFNSSAASDAEVNANNTTQDLTFYIQGTVVPEPSSIILMLAGLFSIGCKKRAN